MDITQVLTVVSLLASGASLLLAIVAISFARNAEREIHDNFARTQDMMQSHHERTKEVLAEIDKRAAVTERTVTDAQDRLLTTMTSIINETVIPKKVNAGEQLGMLFMQQMMEDPDKAGTILEKMKP